MTHEMYHKATPLDGRSMEPCPCCGSDVELWEFQAKPGAACTKVVMCMHSDPIGAQQGLAVDGCPMYMPSDDFYRATQREAVTYWNDFAKALVALREKHRKGPTPLTIPKDPKPIEQVSLGVSDETRALSLLPRAAYWGAQIERDAAGVVHRVSFMQQQLSDFALDSRGWAPIAREQLELIANIAEGSTTANSLPNIGRIARSALKALE